MQPAVQALIDNLIPILGTFLTAVLSILLKSVISYINAKKAGFVSDELSYELNDLVYDAVAFAEEVSHNLAKNGIKNMDGKEKEALAAQTLINSAKKHNLDAGRARQLILTSLGRGRGKVSRF